MFVDTAVVVYSALLCLHDWLYYHLQLLTRHTVTLLRGHTVQDIYVGALVPLITGVVMQVSQSVEQQYTVAEQIRYDMYCVVHMILCSSVMS
jgi:hypothetical protein